MTIIRKNASFTLNGSSKFKIEDETYSWKNRYLDTIAIEPDTSSSQYSVTIKFAGDDWSIDRLHVQSSSSLKTIITETGSGENRSVGTLKTAASSTIALDHVHVGMLHGGSGVDKLTLGDAGAGLVNLGDGKNVLVTGEGRVDRLVTGNGVDNLTWSSDWGDTIFTGGGKDKVTVEDGSFGILRTDDCNDTVIFGGENAYLVDLGAGNNTVTLTGGSVDSVVAEDENDTLVMLDGAEAGSIRLGHGSNTVTMGNATVEHLVGGNQSETVNMTSGRIEIVRLRDGGDALTMNGGASNMYMHAGGGDDTVTIQSGSIQQLVMGEGNDTLNLSSDSHVVFIFQSGDGNDIVTNFLASDDNIIYLQSLETDNFDDLVENRMTQVGDDVVIDCLLGDSITLKDVDLGALDSSHFAF